MLELNLFYLFCIGFMFYVCVMHKSCLIANVVCCFVLLHVVYVGALLGVQTSIISSWILVSKEACLAILMF